MNKVLTLLLGIYAMMGALCAQATSLSRSQALDFAEAHLASKNGKRDIAKLEEAKNNLLYYFNKKKSDYFVLVKLSRVEIALGHPDSEKLDPQRIKSGFALAKKAVKIKPNGIGGYLALVEALLLNKNYKLVEHYLKKVKDYGGHKSSRYLSFLSELYLQTEKYDKADVVIELNIKLAEDEVSKSKIYLNAAKILHQNEKFKKSIIYYEKSLKFDPDNEWIFYQLANAKYSINDYEGAIQFSKKAIDKNPFPEAVHRLALSHYKKAVFMKEIGDEAKAEESLYTSLRIKENYQARVFLGDLLVKKKNYDKALKEYQLALKDEDANRFLILSKFSDIYRYKKDHHKLAELSDSTFHAAKTHHEKLKIQSQLAMYFSNNKVKSRKLIKKHYQIYFEYFSNYKKEIIDDRDNLNFVAGTFYAYSMSLKDPTLMRHFHIAIEGKKVTPRGKNDPIISLLKFAQQGWKLWESSKEKERLKEMRLEKSRSIASSNKLVNNEVNFLSKISSHSWILALSIVLVIGIAFPFIQKSNNLSVEDILRPKKKKKQRQSEIVMIMDEEGEKREMTVTNIKVLKDSEGNITHKIKTMTDGDKTMTKKFRIKRKESA